MILISEKEKFLDPRKPFQAARPETHEEWQARMSGEVLAVVRSGLYLDFRFLDQALSVLTPTADERCGVLATDGTILCYQPLSLIHISVVECAAADDPQTIRQGDFFQEVPADGVEPVSYTHLDVYKRQLLY